MKLLKPFAGLFTNPATGALSHSKLWANIAAALMTYKFATAAELRRMDVVVLRRNGRRLRPD